MKTDPPFLELKGISKAFPGVKALDNVDFDLCRGEVHALVGENGAGKSTLMKILTGVYSMDTGQILLNGRPIQIRNVHHARQLGISIIFQELSQIPQLTVAQNIFLGEEPRRAFGVIDERAIIRRVTALLDEYQLHLDPMAQLSRLSAAERQLAEIAKAVSVGAKILVMDEPTSSLTMDETTNLFRIVNQMRDRQVGIIYISHRMDEVAHLADRITILRDGRNMGMFEANQITIDEVVRLMVGRELQAVDRSQEGNRFIPPPDEASLLEVKGLRRVKVLNDISFTISRGEILGLAGLVGSGRSEVARAIIGIDPLDAGEIRVNGQQVQLKNPAAALAAGIALLPEDRRLQGLILSHTVEHNVMLPLLRRYSRFGVINSAACRRITMQAIERLRIKPPNPNQTVRFLSGGNQQKVVLSKWLAARPALLIVDEPTVGIDVGAKAEIHQLMRQWAAEGMGILLISSDMPEIIHLSHRLLVMHAGRIWGEYSQEEVTQEKIMGKIMESVMTKEGKY